MTQATLAALALSVVLPVFVGGGLLRAAGALPAMCPWFGALAPAFMLGICLWGWFTSAGYWLGLTYWSPALAWVCLGLAGSAVALLRQRTGAAHPPTGTPWLLVAFSLLLGVSLFFVGSHQDASSDTLRHLALIRRIGDSSVLTDRVFQLSVNEPKDLLAAAYAFNGVHVLYALLADLTGSDPARNFLHQPAACALVLVSAHYWLAFGLTRDRVAAAAYVLFLVVSWALLGFGLHRGRTLAYPESLGFLSYVAWAGLLLWMLQEKSGRVAWVLLCVATAGLLYVHAQWWLYSLITLGMATLWTALTKQRAEARLLVFTAAASAVLSVPLLMLRLSHYAEVSGEVGVILKAYFSRYLWQLGPFYGFDPFTLSTGWWSGTRTFWALGGFIAWRAMPRDTPALHRLPAVLAVGVAVVMATPLAMVVAEVASTTLAWRMFELVILWGSLAVFLALYQRRDDLLGFWRAGSVRGRGLAVAATVTVLIVVLFAWPMLQWLHQGSSGDWRVLALALAVLLGVAAFVFRMGVRMAVGLDTARWPEGGDWRVPVVLGALLAVSIWAPGSGWSPWRLTSKEGHYASQTGPLVEQVLGSDDFRDLLATLPDEAVVVTDQPSLLLAFANIRLAGTVHGLTRVGRRLEEAVGRLYDSRTGAAEVHRIARELGAGYIVFSPRHSAWAEPRLSAHPELFRKVFDRELDGITYLDRRYTVFRVVPSPRGRADAGLGAAGQVHGRDAALAPR